MRWQRPRHRALWPFVDRIWVFEGVFEHELERILPSGTVQLLVNLDCNELRSIESGELLRHDGAVLGGAYTSSFVIDTRQQKHIAGVSFHLGGASRFFGDMSAFEQLHVDLADLWRADNREWILDGDPVDRIEALLLERARDLEPNSLVDETLRCLDRGESVGSVRERFGYTTHRLIRTVREHTGLTPKRFSRVRRFHHALCALDAGATRMAELAAQLGYSDQAHMVREFRTFSGLTPCEFQAREPGDVHHVAL